MPVVLFLSPHLDDAVFSCPGRILAEARGGARVIVATLFSHCGRNTAGRPEYRIRRQEDRRALSELGAEHVWMGLPDAPFRDPYYCSFRTIIFGQAPSDQRWMPAIAKELNSLVDNLKPSRIYAPLGVGNHIDHRLTFDAAAALENSTEVIYYEERPYALVPHAVAWRLARLGQRSDAEPGRVDRDYWGALLRASYVRAHLPAGPERALTRRALRAFNDEPAPRSRRWRAAIQTTSERDIPLLADAMYSYQSQAPAFLGPREAYFRCARRHAHSLIAGSDWIERTWRRQPTIPPCSLPV